MRNKNIISGIIALIIFCFSATIGMANENHKAIIINMNRTSLEDMLKIQNIQEEVNKRGYIGLMNIRGDGGSNDGRSYGAIGAGAKSNIISSDISGSFISSTSETSQIYETAIGEKPLCINNIAINKVVNHNSTSGKYGSTLGSMGESLAENNLKVSILGNSDTGFKAENYNREFALMAMDEKGRIPNGTIDNLNIKDAKMPFGMRTDYKKMTLETLRLYEESDVLFIDLGDTYRLDEYREYLNDVSYPSTKESIYRNINKYIGDVLDLVSENDSVYIMSAFPSKLDYKDNKRLSPVIKFTDDKKGLLTSASTRRPGIISNVDIPADILNSFEIKNPAVTGKTFNLIEKNENIEYIENEFEKITTISKVRSSIVNFFVIIIATSWILSAVLLVAKNKIPKDKEKLTFGILKEFIKLGMVMPLAFLIAPITGAKTQMGVIASIVIMVILLIIIAHAIFKNDDIKQMGMYALLIIVIITVDSITGTHLMKNNIMSYDALYGARYYGIGNEYEGVTIASAIFAISVLCNYKKPSKIVVSLFFVIVLIASAHPSMGANVGGAISETIAYIIFLAMLFDVKIDIKKALAILTITGLVVVGFGVADIIMGTESHLSLFIGQIFENGPSAIIETFGRKIAMNLKLVKTSIWANLLLAGVFIMAVFILKPGKSFKKTRAEYPVLFKGFSASMIGCITTLLVNDSGVVSASTASIYILIPLIIIVINMSIFKDEKKQS